MDKYDVMKEIAKAFDERDAAILEVNRLRRELNRNTAIISNESTGDAENDEYALVKANIFLAGKNKVFEDALNYWHTVSAQRNEKGEIVTQSFEKWCERAITSIPTYMSRNQFMDFFKTELESTYESEKLKAINKVRESEEEEE